MPASGFLARRPPPRNPHPLSIVLTLWASTGCFALSGGAYPPPASSAAAQFPDCPPEIQQRTGSFTRARWYEYHDGNLRFCVPGDWTLDGERWRTSQGSLQAIAAQPPDIERMLQGNDRFRPVETASYRRTTIDGEPVEIWSQPTMWVSASTRRSAVRRPHDMPYRTFAVWHHRPYYFDGHAGSRRELQVFLAVYRTARFDERR
jgi:hypothetical protein